jgi:BREX system ATP-binding protein BrxC/D
MSTTRITQRERLSILSSLGAGVVPGIGLQHIQVGRMDEINAMLVDLNKVESGGASIRFVVGRYGSGKTFFLNVIRTVALERKLVVAQADITTERRLQGTSGRARGLYSELMRNLATRSKPDGGGLSSLIERWVGDLAYDVKGSGGNDSDVARQVHEALEPLQDLVSGFDFARVISEYYRGYTENDEHRQDAALRWLRGEYSTKTEARQDLGVRTIIDDGDIYDYVKLFAAFCRIAGYKGLLVSIDELAVLSHRLNNKLARDRNYEAILRILNDCLQGNVEGLGFLFAATDDCLEDTRRGLYSYEALATRLAPNRFAREGLVDLSGPTLRLQSLTPEDCYVLLVNIRRVHALGKEPDSLLPDDGIVAYLDDCNRRMGAAYFQTPRETVRDFVGLLNVLEQNPDQDWRSLVGAPAAPGEHTEDDRHISEHAAEPTPARDGASDDDLSSFKL